MIVLAAALICFLIAFLAAECHRQIRTYRGWTKRLDRIVME